MNAPKPVKLLWLGWSGGNWSLLQPWLEQGLLPCLAGLLQRGVSGDVLSEGVAFNAPAWVGMATGQPPQCHGVVLDKHPVIGHTDIEPVRAAHWQALPVWRGWAEAGHGVCVVNWPGSDGAGEMPWGKDGLAPFQVVGPSQLQGWVTGSAGEAATPPWAVGPDDIDDAMLHELAGEALDGALGDAGNGSATLMARLRAVVAEAATVQAGLTAAMQSGKAEVVAGVWTCLQDVADACLCESAWMPADAQAWAGRLQLGMARWLDSMLGWLCQGLASDATVALVSGHGLNMSADLWRLPLADELAVAALRHSEPGFWAMAGPAVKQVADDGKLSNKGKQLRWQDIAWAVDQAAFGLHTNSTWHQQRRMRGTGPFPWLSSPAVDAHDRWHWPADWTHLAEGDAPFVDVPFVDGASCDRRDQGTLSKDQQQANQPWWLRVGVGLDADAVSSNAAGEQPHWADGERRVAHVCALARHAVARVHLEQGRADAALACLQPSEGCLPSSDAEAGALFEAMVGVGAYESADALLKRLREAGREGPLLWLGFAVVAMGQGKPRQALAEVEKARAAGLAAAGMSVVAEAHVLVGQARLQLGDHAEAQDAFNQAVAATPESEAAWIGLSKACLRVGDWVGAKEAAEQAVDAGPWSAEAHGQLAAVWQAAKDMEKEANAWEQALACDRQCLLALKGMLALSQTDSRWGDPSDWQCRLAWARGMATNRFAANAMV